MVGDIYISAAGVIGSAVDKKGSLKHLCYASEYRNKKKLFALVFETVKHKKLLEEVVAKTTTIWESLDEEIGMPLKLVLLYETLLGRGIHSHSHFHGMLREHRDILVNNFLEISLKYPALDGKEKRCGVELPRYVRVNTLKNDVEDAIASFVNSGFQLVESMKENELAPHDFMIDQDIPVLLVFHRNTDLHSHSLYKEGKILLQDKASCLPAFILNPPPHSFIIDACAAPGNKSSHLASVINNQGVVYSFDLDKERFNVMTKLIYKAGASCVQTKLKDFLKVNHHSPLYSQVDYILLDPSCSGSGIVSRRDALIDGDVETAMQSSRLKGLSGFQTAALSHALSFPHVKKVIYSTCSVHQEENEDVVEKAFKRFSSTFKLVEIMPEWKNRGVGGWDEANKCIRAIPEVDYTNGFFVAMFERISETVKPKLGKKKTTYFAASERCVSDEVLTSERCVSDESSKSELKRTKKIAKRKSAQCTAQLPLDISEPFRFHAKKKRRKGGVKKPVTL